MRKRRRRSGVKEALRRSRRPEKWQEEGMWLEKEGIGKMINEMGEKMMERFYEEFRNLRLELWITNGEKKGRR